MEKKISYIKTRILAFAKEQGIGKGQIAQQLGMSYHSFRGPAKERPLNSNALEVLLRAYPQLSPDWLLLGKGPMLPTIPDTHADHEEVQRLTAKLPEEAQDEADMRTLKAEIGAWMKTLIDANKISEEVRLAYKRLADAERNIGELRLQLLKTEAQLAEAKTN